MKNDQAEVRIQSKPNYFDLSARQKEILILLYRYRFLHSRQLQNLLSQKAHSRMRLWLKELIDWEYIEGKYNPSIKIDRMPTLYFLKKLGLSFIHSLDINNSYLRKLQNEEQPRLEVLNHCLKVADLALLISQYCKDNTLSHQIYTKADLAGFPDYLLIKPDLFINTQDTSYFIELDMETESISRLRKKLQKYLMHFKRNMWHKFSKALYPCIVFVSLSPIRVKRLKEVFEQLLIQYGHPPVVVKLTTVSQIESQGLTQDICLTPFKGNEQFLFF